MLSYSRPQWKWTFVDQFLSTRKLWTTTQWSTWCKAWWLLGGILIRGFLSPQPCRVSDVSECWWHVLKKSLNIQQLSNIKQQNKGMFVIKIPVHYVPNWVWLKTKKTNQNVYPVWWSWKQDIYQPVPLDFERCRYQGLLLHSTEIMFRTSTGFRRRLALLFRHVILQLLGCGAILFSPCAPFSSWSQLHGFQ